MLIPRFTVRWLLALMAVCALLAFVISLAVGGQLWAMAMSLAVVSVLVVLILHASIFCLAWGAAELWRLATNQRVAASPFATHTPPPQILRSEEPD